jgi:hypothetical protein
MALLHNRLFMEVGATLSARDDQGGHSGPCERLRRLPDGRLTCNWPLANKRGVPGFGPAEPPLRPGRVGPIGPGLVAKSACLPEAHGPSASWVEPHAIQVSSPGVSSPPGSPAIGNPAVHAPSESLRGQYPGGSQALSTPRRRRELFRLLGLITASVQSCSARHPRHSWLVSPAHPSHLRPSESPVKLDISSLAVAGSRPATDQSVQEPPPRPIAFGSGPPRKFVRSISVREMRPDEPMMNRPFQQRATAAAALRQRAPGLTRVTVHGPWARPPGPTGPHRSASQPIPIPTRARTSALGGYVTGHGVGLGRGAR